VPVTALFPPQTRDWSLPAEVPLTPRAAERLSREAAEKAFAPAARSLNRDWDTTLDGKQVQRWAEALGRTVVAQRNAEANAFERGVRPVPSANEPELIVVGLDGGRVQGRDRGEDGKILWHEDKVCTVTTYLRGDGREKDQGGREPQKLVTTHVATMDDAEAIGLLARVEAERRGLRQAAEIVLMGDFAPWIDTVREERFPRTARIGDYNHATEHLWDAARAARGPDSPQSPAVAALEGELETLLYEGKVEQVIVRLREEALPLGVVRESDAPRHPRRVLGQEIGFFERNKQHMNYPEYRRRGWPIGSGNTEAGVKQFNKRVKGTEQFWSEPGVEAILALRALWVSQDQRWEQYWLSRPAYQNAA
jgi:hypothetical protein